VGNEAVHSNGNPPFSDTVCGADFLTLLGFGHTWIKAELFASIVPLPPVSFWAFFLLYLPPKMPFPSLNSLLNLALTPVPIWRIKCLRSVIREMGIMVKKKCYFINAKIRMDGEFCLVV
jgi:hypothetical protein